jgi:hypothetical protein
MEIHEEFTKWAVDRGVKINDVSAHRFNGRGLGIIADKKLEVCKTTYTCGLFCFAVPHFLRN